MAAVLEEQLGVATELIRGHGGVFEVRVGDRVVASKGLEGFPTEEQCVRAVREALTQGETPT